MVKYCRAGSFMLFIGLVVGVVLGYICIGIETGFIGGGESILGYGIGFRGIGGLFLWCW